MAAILAATQRSDERATEHGSLAWLKPRQRVSTGLLRATVLNTVVANVHAAAGARAPEARQRRAADDDEEAGSRRKRTRDEPRDRRRRSRSPPPRSRQTPWAPSPVEARQADAAP